MAVLRMVSKTIGREIVASYNRQFAPLVQALIGIGGRIHFVNSKVSGEQCEIYCLRTTPQKCIAAVFIGTTKKQSIFPVTIPSHGYGFRLYCFMQWEQYTHICESSCFECDRYRHSGLSLIEHYLFFINFYGIR